MSERRKEEPGAPLVLQVQPDKPRANACGDCRHFREHPRIVSLNECVAFSTYADWARGGMTICPAFSERRHAPPAVRHKPGWLLRLVMRLARWVW